MLRLGVTNIVSNFGVRILKASDVYNILIYVYNILIYMYNILIYVYNVLIYSHTHTELK